MSTRAGADLHRRRAAPDGPNPGSPVESVEPSFEHLSLTLDAEADHALVHPHREAIDAGGGVRSLDRRQRVPTLRRIEIAVDDRVVVDTSLRIDRGDGGCTAAKTFDGSAPGPRAITSQEAATPPHLLSPLDPRAEQGWHPPQVGHRRAFAGTSARIRGGIGAHSRLSEFALADQGLRQPS
jgi:hypothetical protein